VGQGVAFAKCAAGYCYQEAWIAPVRVDVFTFRGFIGQYRRIGIKAIQKGVEMSYPFFRVGFLKMSHGNGSGFLLCHFPKPVFERQALRHRFGLQRFCLLIGQINLYGFHGIYPFHFNIKELNFFSSFFTATGFLGLPAREYGE
jgi:hypothetical protein